MTFRELYKTVMPLLENGKAAEARRFIEHRLSEVEDSQRRERGTLLDVLVLIEMHGDRWRAALAALDRRRTLISRNSEKYLNESLLMAQLLMKTGQWSAARNELTEILSHPKSRNWSSILDALATYVDADERCRLAIDVTLMEGCKASLKMFGIPLSTPTGRDEVSDTILRARGLFRAASKSYQELNLRALEATTPGEWEPIVAELKVRAKTEKVGFFREEARGWLEQLDKKKNR